MKKLLAVILTLALILPAAALADDQDPIVGCWYVLIDVNIFPEKELEKIHQNIHLYRTQLELHVLRFTEKGEIYRTITSFEEYQTDTTDGAIHGTWSKTDDGTYNVTVNSTWGPAVFDGDDMFLLYYNNKYMRFRKMDAFDLDTDLHLKR